MQLTKACSASWHNRRISSWSPSRAGGGLGGYSTHGGENAQLWANQVSAVRGSAAVGECAFSLRDGFVTIFKSSRTKKTVVVQEAQR